MDSLLKQNVQAVIIDLRENPGGLLDAAVEVCSLFIPEGKTVVSLEGRDPRDNKTFKTLKNQKYEQIPLLLLVNQNSASCSEIMAGCFQDHKRAPVLGTRTFGKASVQTLFPDKQSGTALRITTARYCTPNAQPIHEKGITPDLEIKLSESVRQTILNRLRAAGPAAQATLPESIRDTQYLHGVNTLYGMLWQEQEKKEKADQTSSSADRSEME